MEEIKYDKRDVRIVRNFKVASFLIKRGYIVINIKRHRDFICEITNLPCDYRTVFAFDATDENFLRDLEYAKLYYEEI